MQLLLGESGSASASTLQRLGFSCLALIPGMLLSWITTDLTYVVALTGSVPALGIMYVTPAALVLFGRWRLSQHLVGVPNPFASPFGTSVVYSILCGWCVLSLAARYL
jgi:hypothetical protein